MTNKPKVLWVGDAVATTGFARVTHHLIEHLLQDFEVVVLGSNYHGDPHDYPYKIYPATNRFATASFGEQRIRDIVIKEKPDLVFCINDSWIINDLYANIKDLHEQNQFKFIGYYPVDGTDWFNVLSVTANHWDKVLVYTKFGVQEASKAGLKTPATYFPHGLDDTTFYPTDKREARKALGLPLDRFIVFNGNRNQPRKRIDLTIKAFAEFAINAEDAVLFLHMGTKDMGWNVQQLFAKEMMKRGLDPSRRMILSSPHVKGIQGVSVEMLNQIYNCADVGLNTCEGEGWGLVNFEHAACRVAQVVPNHTSCKEIFEGYGDLIDVEHEISDRDFGRDMFAVSYKHCAQILWEHYSAPDYNQAQAEKCYGRVMQKQFRWSELGQQLTKILKQQLQLQAKPQGFSATKPLNLSNRKQKKKLAALN